ncbi:uncharacterized protein LOC26534751 [Drosophila yakuba]|uniref:Uncharacterized protein n=1 Tax=Drosophila yakuba TaxID=7245 RepID=A0A0R1DIS2_DROYA|nr:uncharacterized protein LOC26534751 [Drosophila yakuba]KRJ97098.1 uncharacterized protein Dyak_GE27570 [Drosophila yakuba]
MFRLHIGFLCLVVAFCILFGVCHASSDSICVLSDAPQQCGAFCLAALHPLYDQYSKSRQQEHSQEAMVKIIADSRAEQKETMVKMIKDFRTEQKELVTHYYQDVRELVNVLAAKLDAAASRHESTLQSSPAMKPAYTVHPISHRIRPGYVMIKKKEGREIIDL